MLLKNRTSINVIFDTSTQHRNSRKLVFKEYWWQYSKTQMLVKSEQEENQDVTTKISTVDWRCYQSYIIMDVPENWTYITVFELFLVTLMPNVGSLTNSTLYFVLVAGEGRFILSASSGISKAEELTGRNCYVREFQSYFLSFIHRK